MLKKNVMFFTLLAMVFLLANCSGARGMMLISGTNTSMEINFDDFTGTITQRATLTAGTSIDFDVTTVAGRLVVTLVDESGRVVYIMDTNGTHTNIVTVDTGSEHVFTIEGRSYSGEIIISWGE